MWKWTPTYKSWVSMRKRCLNPNARDFKYWGGRGVTICERWATYANFLADMGERPEGKTLDRIKSDGHYEPGNCRWATPKEQSSNTSRTVYVTWAGKRYTLKELAERLEIKYDNLHHWNRVKGLRIDKAVARTRAVGVIKSHCSHGHEYTPANTYMWDGRRFCRTCNVAHAAKRKAISRAPSATRAES